MGRGTAAAPLRGALCAALVLCAPGTGTRDPPRAATCPAGSTGLGDGGLRIDFPAEDERLSAGRGDVALLQARLVAKAHDQATVCLFVAPDGGQSARCAPVAAGEWNAVTLPPLSLPVGDARLAACLCPGAQDCAWGTWSAPCTGWTPVKVLEPLPFEPSATWQPVQAWQSVPAGLEVRLNLDGGGRLARIPNPLPIKATLRVDCDEHLATRVDVAVHHTQRAAPVQALLDAFAAAQGLVRDCLRVQGLSENASLPELFARSREERFLPVCVDASSSALCRCGPRNPCAAETAALSSCLAKHELAPDRAALQPLCQSERAVYMRCTVVCSGFGDAGPALETFGTPPTRPSMVFASALRQRSDEVAVPGRQQAVVCLRCGFRDGRVQVFASEHLAGRARRRVVLGRSRFAPYYESQGGGVLEADVVSREEAAVVGCTRVEERPALLISAWSLHNVYHLVSDVILPALASLEAAGLRSEDATLFVDVGHAEERSKLQHVLAMARDADAPVSMLTKIFRSVHALQWLREQPGQMCFHQLFVEARIAGTPHHYAYLGAPHASVLPPRDEHGGGGGDGPLAEATRQLVGLFRARLQGKLRLQWRERLAGDCNVSIVKRRGTRRLLAASTLKRNARALLQQRGLSGAVKEVVLEQLSFSQQLQTLQDTSVLVCVHGQGCTNSVFLPPGATLVLIMPLGWRGWQWMYGNLARAGGLRVVVLRHIPSSGDETEGWDGRDSDYEDSDAWGFHSVRDPPIALHPHSWSDALEEALTQSCDIQVA